MVLVQAFIAFSQLTSAPRGFMQSKNSKPITILFTMGQQLALNAISVPATAYIIRGMGATAYGSWTTATGLMLTLSFLTNLGLRMGFIRDIAQQPDNAAKLFAEQIGLRLLLSLVATAIAVTASRMLGYPALIIKCTLISGIAFILSSIVNTFVDFCQAVQRLKQTASINFVAGLVLTVLSVVAIWLGYGPVGLCVAYLSGPIVSVSLFFLFVQRNYFLPSISWNLKRQLELLHRVRHLAAQLAVGNFGGQAQSVLVPKLVGITPFGYFSAGMAVTSRLYVIPDVLSTAYLPTLIALAKNDRIAMLALLRKYMLTSVLCSAAVGILVAVCAWPIAILVFPDKALACWQALLITSCSLPLVAFESVISYSLQACGRDKEMSKRSMQSTVVGFLITLLLISNFGYLGACWSVVTRPTIAILLLASSFWKEIGRTHQLSFSHTVTFLVTGQLPLIPPTTAVLKDSS